MMKLIAMLWVVSGLVVWLGGCATPVAEQRDPGARFDQVLKEIEGFPVYIEQALLEGEHAAVGGKSIAMLRNHLERINVLVPEPALIPKGSKNIIVAGRCLSSDRLANSGLRVQAPCMAMGQAAACAAAIAAKDGTTPGEVPLDKLQAMLKDHGAIIPKKS